MPTVVQISFFSDPQQRPPQALLRAWPTLVDLAEAASRAGVQVEVIQASSHWARLEQGGITYHFLPFAGDAQSAAGKAALRDLLAGLKPDVLHAQGLGFPSEVLDLAAMAPGTPLLLQDRADRPPRRFWRWPLWRRSLSAAQGLAFCAGEQARPFRWRGLLSGRSTVYELPGSSSRFMPQDQAMARLATRISGAPALLWVAHLDRNKDPLTVLEAASLAAAQLPGLRLWCCFDKAPLLSRVQDRIASDPRLAGRVHLLGRLAHEQVAQLMCAADFLVQGSHRESTGYSVIEALACGLPPIVTDIPSFRALTARGEVGCLWPRGDAQALAQAIVQMAGLPPAPLRAAARLRFEQALSFDALGSRLSAVYNELRGDR